jgi:hypothetical protein
MTILLSTIIMNFQLLFGMPPSPDQLNQQIQMEQQSGVVVVIDTTGLN